jgi:hypothetical protein
MFVMQTDQVCLARAHQAPASRLPWQLPRPARHSGMRTRSSMPRSRVTQMGAHCDMTAPNLVPVMPGDRSKTEHRDAEQPARCHRSGDLVPVRVPDVFHEVYSSDGLDRVADLAVPDVFQ